MPQEIGTFITEKAAFAAFSVMKVPFVNYEGDHRTPTLDKS